MTFLAGPAALIAGPHRAVAVLCVTMILGWAALFYPPALTMTYIAEAHGWSLALALSGFSIALGTSGLCAPYACGLIDRYGGNPVMAGGALIGALGLLLLPLAPNYPVYLISWLLIGVATACCLYDPAFTTLTRIYGMASRRPITIVTFAGGLASTAGWPLMHFLIENFGWQSVYYTWAAVFTFLIAPLYWFALPRRKAPVQKTPAVVANAPPAKARFIPPYGLPFILMAAGFAGHSFVMSGTTTHLLPILQRGGIDAGTAVMIGAMFGPAQVLARFADFASRGRLHPIWVARVSMGTMVLAFTVLAVSGIAPLPAMVFALLFGAGNGVVTIARGALPLATFGSTGYGRVVGRISRPAQIMQALAPFVLAFVIDRWSDQVALDLLIATSATALVCFAVLRRV
ncbi:Oxalate/formate antiporter family transporter OS=Afipia felis OX=1035 GN=BN961_02796 PE=4 SV=1 [Afipia felis]